MEEIKGVKRGKFYDYFLIIVILLLCIFGTLMVYSSSMIIAIVRHDVSSFFFKKQMISLMIGLICFFITAFIPYQTWKKKIFQYLIFFASPIVLLFLFLVAKARNNAVSWYDLGLFSLQPSEIVKIGLIIYLASAYANKGVKDFTVKQDIFFPMYYMLLICVLIALQPDYGMTIIVFVVSITMIASSGFRLTLLLKQGIFLSIVTALFVTPISLIMKIFGFNLITEIFSTERISRVTGFLDPFADPGDSGLQLINSYLAIASGGFQGRGLGQSIQKYGGLFAGHTDFIIAIISEELGFLGIAFVIGALAFIVLRGYWIARKCNDSFGSLLAIGISTLIGVQTCINLFASTGLLPITGVTLPFVSYGGSSLITLLGAAGILVNISTFTRYEDSLEKVPTGKKPFLRKVRNIKT